MESAGVPPSVWFPVVSVVAGFLCKALLDHLADKRRAEAEATARREARIEAARLRRIGFQRGVLIELQETLEVLGRCVTRANIEDVRAYRGSGKWGKNFLEGTLDEDLRKAQSKVLLLATRVDDPEVRGEAEAFRTGVTRVLLARSEDESEAAMSRLINASAPLHEKVGAAVRKLDQDEYMLLG